MKKRKYLILALSLLWIVSIGNNTYAQISEGGTPASFAFQDGMQLRSTKKPYVTQINFDVAKLKAEDKVAAEQNMPLRAAVIIPAGLSLEHNGEWSTLPDGQRICRLTIKAPGAIATMLYYNKFDIPEGGRLFIYNPDKTHLLGAYTSRTNPNHTEFATEFVAGDELILEYNAPPVLHGKRKFLSSNNEQPSIEISGISYGYNYLNIHKTDDQLPIGDAGKCMVNINCPEGDNWQDQKKGVALSITPFGDDGILCSGTLVNNTALDQTPYFLTAGHCLYYDETKCSQWNQILYYFHFESPGCSDANPTNSKTAVGAQLLVEVPTNGGSDGALLKLNSSIPTNWNVYYNGWDRRNTGATSGVCIHHPQGDIKKISTFTTTATSVTVGYSDGDKGATLAHWKVIFAQTQSGHGSIEGGSSGSPLFNQNKLVVGTLSAGGDGCSDPASPAVYGKLWYHWDNTNIAGNVSKKMKDYLDPVGSGVEFLNGTYTSGDPTQANLQSLTVNTGTLSPAFNASTTSYTVNVANSVSSITIAATAADANATITGTGSHTLNVGNNTINVVVTAQNKSTTKTYTITVVRAGASTENDFYIAGYEYNGSKWIAKYWKNGTSVALSNGSQDAYGESVAVVGNDVYVAGCEVNSSGKLVAKYWKNGTAVSLTNGNQNAEAFSIVVSGSNVYVTGYESNGSKTVAKYWKNGTAVTLTNGTQDAETVSITVSGNDVYVAGFEYNGNNWVAKYWKNGTATALSNKSQNSYAEEIKIIDGDIYVAGMEAENSILVAKYWKNGTAVTLTNGSQKAQAESIAVSDGNVYIAGIEKNSNDLFVAKYWKNGTATTLSDGSKDAYAWSIAVAGNDTYVAGSETGTITTAKYWKNGTGVALTDGKYASSASQIILVTKESSNNNADLSSLTVNQGTLTPAFSANATSYTVNVANNISNITVSATAADANATITGTGNRTLNVGDNTINVVVTAPDGTTKKTYAITVTRATGSDNANLESLTVNQGMLTPVFNASTTSYMVSVANNVASITISAIAADANATVTGTGNRTLNVGGNTINVVVTAENGTTAKTYSIVVTRQGIASNDVTLGTLTVNNLPTQLQSGTNIVYEITINYCTSITIAATPNHPAATIGQGGLGVKPVNTGLNIFNIIVTAEDGTSLSYKLEVTVKAEGVTGVGDEDAQPMVVYPNPAREYITISGLQGKGTLTVFDAIGKRWVHHKTTQPEEKLFIGHLPKGNYFVQVTEGKTVKTVKITIDH